MGLTAILESSIMQRGLPATAGSRMLEGFVAPVDATVVERLAASGVDIVGRADTSEFGVSGLLELTCQGDGSPDITGAVNRLLGDISKGKADVALCNDYTGAISCAAATAGLFYVHPTYSTVSRYGLIQSVASIDQIGVICKSAEVGFQVLKIISGYDSKDGVMPSDRVTNPDGVIVPNEAKVKRAEDLSPCSCFSSVYQQVMQILCCAELSNNISRYDGIKFGYRAKDYKGLDELYTKSRTEAFGEDIKLAALLGAMVLSLDNYERYYDKAMRIRRLIKESLEFDKYDLIVTQCPLLSRLCGLPALTSPEHVFIANAGREDVLEAKVI